jgi:3-phosphoshikimate 1-carboxyvinyltransferase/cytidylate kinase
MIPVIAIDGPSASGKGTIAQQVATQLGFHYLDSGALYRVTVLACLRQGVDLSDELKVSVVASHLHVQFTEGNVLLDGMDVSSELRTEEAGKMASTIATYPSVRAALLERQRAFQQEPGLVAEGRDMGSVVFPNATLKVFLTARTEVRAERRYKQLISKGLIESTQNGIFENILADLTLRDEQDQRRVAAPLKQQADAKLLDTSEIGIEAAIQQILRWYREK